MNADPRVVELLESIESFTQVTAAGVWFVAGALLYRFFLLFRRSL